MMLRGTFNVAYYLCSIYLLYIILDWETNKQTKNEYRKLKCDISLPSFISIFISGKSCDMTESRISFMNQ